MDKGGTKKAMNVKSQIINRQSSIANRQSPIRKLVVLAASAGGIDALTQVLSRMPADLPAAIIVVQHLRDDRKTSLPEYIDLHCPLRVCLVVDGMALEEKVVYLAEPGHQLRVRNGKLVMSQEGKVNYVQPSADVMFAAAAQAFGPRLIGVVLSGTGRDGARGCQDIKAAGGVTIAQDEGTSRYSGMARAAIDIGAIDYVLPVSEIAEKIIELLIVDC